VKIYTKTGDAGETALFDSSRVSKADARVDAYGEVDELNACLGAVRAAGLDADLTALVEAIQKELFALGARLADPSKRIASRVSKAAVEEADVERLEHAIDRLESANVRMIRPGWLMAPRTKNFLMKLRDGNGNRVYREDMHNGMLENLPFRTTTNIPTNLGVGGDESEIYLVDFATIIVGEAFDLEVMVSDQASFTQNGQQNGFQQDETLVRALMAHDINARQRGREITVITEVDWF